MTPVSEERLIEILGRYFVPHPRVLVGPGDDAMILSEVPGRALVISVDAQCEGVHFFREFMSFPDIGHRALSSALSDLAAMAAEPLSFLVNLECSPGIGEEEAKGIYEGFRELQEAFYISPAGGNVVRGEKLSLVITVIGEIKREKVLSRYGIQEGDLVVVTGDLGRSLGGLKILKDRLLREKVSQEAQRVLLEKFKHPWPRIREMRETLRNVPLHAAIDISDGLGLDLSRMLGGNPLEIIVEEEKLPLHAAVKELAQVLGVPAWELAVSSGEEYEVAFTLREGHFAKLSNLPFPLTPIGKVQSAFKSDVKLLRGGGEEVSIAERGFDHLGEETL